MAKPPLGYAEVQPPLPAVSPCAAGQSVDLLDLVDDSAATIAVIKIFKQDIAGQDATRLSAHVTTVLVGQDVKSGNVVVLGGRGNGMKALNGPLDARVTGPGTELLLSCGGGKTNVSAFASLSAVKRCLALREAKGTSAARARLLADALMSDALLLDEYEADLVMRFARRALCRGTDRLASVLAIGHVAAEYGGDPMTVWDLLDGLRVRPKGDFAEAIGCKNPPRLVVPKNGADVVNGAAFGIQLDYGVRERSVTWLQTAQELLKALPATNRAALVKGIDRKRRQAALGFIDADKVKARELKVLHSELARPSR